MSFVSGGAAHNFCNTAIPVTIKNSAPAMFSYFKFFMSLYVRVFALLGAKQHQDGALDFKGVYDGDESGCKDTGFLRAASSMVYEGEIVQGFEVTGPQPVLAGQFCGLKAVNDADDEVRKLYAVVDIHSISPKKHIPGGKLPPAKTGPHTGAQFCLSLFSVHHGSGLP
jgi:hypothetical protein